MSLAVSVAYSAPEPQEPASYGEERERFVAAMSDEHGFDRESLSALLRRASWRPEIVRAMDRPYEAQPWYRYRRIFLTPERVASGVAYWRAHSDVLGRAESVYGVSPEVVVAILGIETAYGRRLGNHRVLDALTTLGFSYPKRSDFFLKELESLLLLSREEGVDPVTAKGSYAGALGKPQFIPSSYRAYAVDFDGDGRRDLWGSDADAIGSIANYLQVHGWRRGEPIAFPVSLRDGAPPGLEVGDKAPLAPNTTAGQLRAAGADWRDPVASDTPMALIRLETEPSEGALRPSSIDVAEDGVQTPVEYWAGLGNFYAITRYNRSNLYAMAVFQLGQETRARRKSGT